MKPEDARPADDPFIDLLAAQDEAVAAGLAPDQLAPNAADPDLHARLERALACVRLLETKWPRSNVPHGSATQTPPRDTAEPPTTDLGQSPTAILGNSSAEPAILTTAQLPHEIGRFQIERELGHGGFGIVFLAFDPRLKRDVALKVPRPGALMTPELRSRFVREARAAAGLDHPNILPVFEAGDAGAVCYLASAYCRGPTLARWLKDRTQAVPVHVAASLTARLADAVQHAHTRGVLHRDLTPSNVLLEPRGDGAGGTADHTTREPIHDDTLPFEPRIADFGLAKFLNEQADETKTGVVLGTASYIAPEQATGKRLQIGPAVDIYALGAILYELLTGRPPFQGDTPLDIVQQVQAEEPLPPGRLRPKTPRDIETICLKCLQKEPIKRYGSALELANDLQRFVRGEPIHARPVSRAEKLWSWCRRKPLPAVLSLVLVAVIAGSIVALAVLWRRAEEQRGLAELNAEKFDDERQRAERNLDSAWAAVRQHFVQISDIKLDDPSDPVELKKKQLDAALRYFQDFLNQRSGDLALRLEVADAHYRVGIINSQIGPKDSARASFEAARALQEQLAQENPDDRAYQYALAVIVNEEAGLDQSHGDLTSAQRRFDQVRTICERLLTEEPDSEQFREQLARAWHNLGNIYMARQDMTKAVEAFAEARRFFGPLIERDPSNPIYTGGLALTCHNLGHVYRVTGNKESARNCYDEAREIQEKLLQRFPMRVEAQTYLATTYNSLGVLYAFQFQEADPAIAYFEKSRVLQEKLVQNHPAVITYKVELARTMSNLGGAQRFVKDLDGATRSFEQARTLQKDLINDYSDLPQYQLEFAYTCGGLAGLKKDAGDLAAAAKYYESALEVLQNLVRAHPARLDFRNHLGGNLHNLALVLDQMDRRDEALAKVEQAIEHQRIAFDRAPQVVQHRQYLRNHYAKQAELLRGFGRLPESVAALEEYQKVCAGQPDQLFFAACEIALCASAVGRGESELSEADAATRAKYCDQAMDGLRRAVAAGFKNAELVENSTELDPLRNREDFQKVRAEMTKK